MMRSGVYGTDERDFETLSQGLDIQDQGMVRLILDYLDN